jgi:hypothetical protein
MVGPIVDPGGARLGAGLRGHDNADTDEAEEGHGGDG